jgi:hypothetical protein
MSARRDQAISDGEAQMHSWRETLALIEAGQVTIEVAGADATVTFAAELEAQISLMARILDALRD